MAALEQSQGELHARLTAQVETARQAAEQAQASRAQADDHAGRGGELLEAMQRQQKALAELREHLAAQEQEFRDRLNQGREMVHQASEALGAARESAAQAASAADATAQTADEIRQAHQQVSQFAAQIDRHAQELAQAREDSQAVVGDLRDRVERTLEDVHSRTDELVARNSQLQVRMSTIMGQATECGLASQFDDRHADAARSRRRWGRWMLTVAVSSALLLGGVLPAVLIGAGWQLAVVLVLGVCVPVTSALAFCSAQYRRERRLEEEYAYRATAGRALAACRSILIELKGSDVGQAEIVQRLLRDLTDNPVDRVWANLHKPIPQQDAAEEAEVEVAVASPDQAPSNGDEPSGASRPRRKGKKR